MASGLSKRMGENKLLLDFKGKKLFKYVVNTVQKSDIKQKIIVSSYDEILNFCRKNTNFSTVKNENNLIGQSQSIILGVKNSAICDGFIFLPCDMPFIDNDTINSICKYFYLDKDSILVPRINGKNSMPTIFPYKFREDLLNISGDIGGRDIIKSNIENVRYLDINNSIVLKDIDTKEDYDMYK